MNKLHLDNSPITYYTDTTAGSGSDWIVFVHAAFADSSMFKRQFEYFSGKYNIIAIDVIGHGGSLAACKGDGIEKTAYWLSCIFQKHGIAAAHLVGVSLGAVLIQDFANRYEDRVLSLACFGGYDINNFDTKAQRANSKGQMGMMLKALISVKWFAQSNKRISAYTAQAQQEFYDMNARFPKRSFRYLAGLNKLINKFPSKPRKYPLLVGCGEHDIPMELTIARVWASKERCSPAVIQGAGHCANMDNPDRFNSVLQNFFCNLAE